MPDLTPDEARRLLAGIERRREEALDAGDTAEVGRLEAEAEAVRAQLDAPTGKPAKKAGGIGKPLLWILIAFGACGFLSLLGECGSDAGDDATDAATVTTTTPEEQAAADSARGVQEGAEAIQSAYRVKSAVRHILEQVANDPESVEVRSCSAPTLLSPETPQAGIVTCDWTARNGFGGTVREVTRFVVRGSPSRDVIALPYSE